MIDLDKIESALKKYPRFRRAQVFDAIFKGLCEDWTQATNLPTDLKKELESISSLGIKSKSHYSKDQKTVKTLIYLDDENCIETVLMRTKDRNSVCVSTQVGCPMGCAFCDSGRMGFSRNLTISEIIAQVLFFSRYLKKQNEHVTNIVFMGMGEPFLNYDNVVSATRILSDKITLGLSLRRFSISTSGIVPGIKKLSKEKDFPVNLAISLHSAIDPKREAMMPVAKKYPLDQLSAAVRDYFQETKRKVMYEYVMLGGVNISKKDAVSLREFIDAAGAAYVVNLIPYNATDSGYKSPSDAEIKKFKEYLDEYKISYVQRFSFGQDIQAACGQLVRGERNC